MSPRKLRLLIVAAVLFAAAIHALSGLLQGESPTPAILGGLLWAVLFVPVFLLLMRGMERRRQRRLGMTPGSTLTDSREPIRITDGCRAATSLETAAAAVERQIAEMNGRPERMSGTDGSVRISAGFGSRLAMRLLGIYLSAGRRRMPMKLDLELREAGPHDVVADITATSDEGWYLVRVASLEAEYERALGTLVSQVRGALDDASSEPADQQGGPTWT